MSEHKSTTVCTRAQLEMKRITRTDLKCVGNHGNEHNGNYDFEAINVVCVSHFLHFSLDHLFCIFTLCIEYTVFEAVTMATHINSKCYYDSETMKSLCFALVALLYVRLDGHKFKEIEYTNCR